MKAGALARCGSLPAVAGRCKPPIARLVPKLRLGHALSGEALLRSVARPGALPPLPPRRKQSFQDKGVTKHELGHEEKKRLPLPRHIT